MQPENTTANDKDNCKLQVMFNNVKVIYSSVLLSIWRCIVLFHNVLPKMPGAFAREVTLTTLEGLFSSVLALVLF